MPLYLISQTENDDYDTYDSAVVVAKDEETARNTLPSKDTKWEDHYKSWASSPSNVTVKLIGTEVEGLVGVICASFNAG